MELGTPASFVNSALLPVWKERQEVAGCEVEAGLLILYNEIKRLGFTPSEKTAKVPYELKEGNKNAYFDNFILYIRLHVHFYVFVFTYS